MTEVKMPFDVYASSIRVSLTEGPIPRMLYLIEPINLIASINIVPMSTYLRIGSMVCVVVPSLQ